MTTRLRPPGVGAPARASASGSGAPGRPRPLGDGARLRPDRSLIADAQRRFNAVAGEDDVLGKRPLPDPPPQAGEGKGSVQAGGKAVLPRAGWKGRPPGEVELSLLTHQARALYEGRVVPVRALARLCGVSLPHALLSRAQAGLAAAALFGAARPREVGAAEGAHPRLEGAPPGRAARLEGARPGRPGGCARRGRTRRRAVGRGSVAGAGAAGNRGQGAHPFDHDAGAARLALARDGREGKAARARKARKPTRRPYQWRPMYVPPLRSDRWRRD